MATAGSTTSSGDSTVSAAAGLAGRYAAALYALADERHQLNEVVEQMAALGRLIDDSADLRRLLASPLIDINTARRAIRTALEGQGFGKLVLDFTGVVAANRRLSALRDIVATFAALEAQKRGVVVAEVTSAHPLSEVQQQQLRARLIEAGYGNVDMVTRIDPSLLGGLIVRIGARLYDTSLKSRLQRLQFAMKGAA